MELGTVHHVAIICSDYEKAREFYVEKLGLPLVWEVCRPEREDRILMLQAGDMQIELFVEKNPPARVTGPEALGLRHLAFRVSSVEETVRELNARGIQTEPIRLDPYTKTHMTFFRDPDGLPLELHE